MTLWLSNRDGDGKTSEEGHYKFTTNAFSGEVLKANDLKVTQQTPNAMGVSIAVGQYRVPSLIGEYAYVGWSDAATNVTISAADATNPRYTAVVLYIDLSEDTSPAPPNNPGIAKFATVDGTPAGSPTVPTNPTIQSAVGSNNPFIRLANVYVAANASTIVNANIADTRVGVRLIADVASYLYPVGSVYINAGVNTNPNTLLGFGTWTAFGSGRVLVGVDTGQTEFNTLGNTGGAKTHTLTIPELPAHTHGSGTMQVRANVGDVASGQPNLDDFPGSAGPISATNAQVGSLTGTSGSTGSGTAHNNLQPYITVYMWQRTA